MGLKRKPPAGNVRRVKSINGSFPGTTVNKEHQTVQVESFQERLQYLRFNRDPTVRNFVSQPETLTWKDDKKHIRHYTPDCIVWRTNDETEMYEITRTERLDQPAQKERMTIAGRICKDRDWRYIVQTEANLPNRVESANLLALARFRPTSWADPEVVACWEKCHKPGEALPLLALADRVAASLETSANAVLPTLCHLLWHSRLMADLKKTLFAYAYPTRQAIVWRPEQSKEAGGASR
jgi:hypothetical protein